MYSVIWLSVVTSSADGHRTAKATPLESHFVRLAPSTRSSSTGSRSIELATASIRETGVSLSVAESTAPASMIRRVMARRPP